MSFFSRSRLSRRFFFTLGLAGSLLLSAVNDIRAGQHTDVDNDGCADFVAVRREGAQLVWYITPASNDNSRMPPHFPRVVLAGRNAVRVPFGLHGDQPLLFDLTGDGKPELIVFRPSNGRWYIRWSSWDGALELPFVAVGMPHALYFDADNIGDLAFVNFPAQTMTIRLSNGTITNASTNHQTRLGRPPQVVNYPGWRRYFPSSSGELGVVSSGARQNSLYRFFSKELKKVAEPNEQDDSFGFTIVGDFDGDGIKDSGSYIDGRWRVWSRDTKIIDQFWGLPGLDIPILGDFDGDGKFDRCVWRQSTSTYYIIPSRGAPPPASRPHYGGYEIQWGFSTDYVIGTSLR